MPLPIFSWSGDHSRMSYLGSLSFQLIRFSSLVQPLEDSERTAIDSTTSYLISLGILATARPITPFI